MNSCEKYGILANGINNLLKKIAQKHHLNSGDYFFVDSLIEMINMIDDKPCSCSNCIEFLMNEKFFVEYLNEIDIVQLRQKLQYWEVARSYDNILNIGCKTLVSDFSGVEKVDIDDSKITVYLDFNIINDYGKDHIVKEKIDQIVLESKIFFIYSPVHIEELCRMKNVYEEKNCLKNITKITNDREILNHGGKLEFCIESVYDCENRVRKNINLLYAGEDLRFVRSNDKKVFHPEYLGEQHTRMVNNCNISDFNDDELNKILSTVSSFRSIEEYRNSDEKLDDFNYISEALRSLYNMFDILSFNYDKNEKTIRSGTYDIEHLVYSTKCDYFVTKDKKMLKRAKEIFRVLRLNTKAISKEEFFSLKYYE